MKDTYCPPRAPPSQGMQWHCNVIKFSFSGILWFLRKWVEALGWPDRYGFLYIFFIHLLGQLGDVNGGDPVQGRQPLQTLPGVLLDGDDEGVLHRVANVPGCKDKNGMEKGYNFIRHFREK